MGLIFKTSYNWYNKLLNAHTEFEKDLQSSIDCINDLNIAYDIPKINDNKVEFLKINSLDSIFELEHNILTQINMIPIKIFTNDTEKLNIFLNNLCTVICDNMKQLSEALLQNHLFFFNQQMEKSVIPILEENSLCLSDLLTACSLHTEQAVYQNSQFIFYLLSYIADKFQLQSYISEFLLSNNLATSDLCNIISENYLYENNLIPEISEKTKSLNMQFKQTILDNNSHIPKTIFEPTFQFYNSSPQLKLSK